MSPASTAQLPSSVPTRARCQYFTLRLIHLPKVIQIGTRGVSRAYFIFLNFLSHVGKSKCSPSMLQPAKGQDAVKGGGNVSYRKNVLRI